MELGDWVAVHTRSRAEQSVGQHLVAKGYEIFLPLASIADECCRPACGRPLFPGYLFCRVTAMSNGLIVSTPGVIRLLGYGGKPVAIDASEIEALRRIDNTEVPREGCAWFPTGTQVVVESGPLAGLAGLVVESLPRRLIVSISLMQRSVKVQMDRGVLIRPMSSKIGGVVVPSPSPGRRAYG